VFVAGRIETTDKQRNIRCEIIFGIGWFRYGPGLDTLLTCTCMQVQVSQLLDHQPYSTTGYEYIKTGRLCLAQPSCYASRSTCYLLLPFNSSFKIRVITTLIMLTTSPPKNAFHQTGSLMINAIPKD